MEEVKKAQAEFSQFLLFCEKVINLFEVGKCYQLKSECINLGIFSHCVISISKMSVIVVFDTLISISPNYDYEKEFEIIDNGVIFIEYRAIVDNYQIIEVSQEHFLNIQSRVIALNITKKQLIKEFIQKRN